MNEGDQIPPEWVSSGTKLAALSRFHAGLAHDLNNRFTTILGYLSVLDELLPDETDMLADLHHAANEAAELVRLSHTFHKRDSLPLAPVEFGRLLTRLQDLLGRLCQSPGAVPVLLPDEDLYILGEDGALEQILVHILGECLDSPPARLILRADGPRVCLDFQGLSLPRLPEPAARLVDAFQGEWICDRDGATLRFPKLELELPAPAPLPPPPPGLNLLLAEGDATLRSRLAEQLRQQGFLVQTAADVPECLQLLAQDSFDRAVLDTRLPGGGHSALATSPALPLRTLWMEPYAGADRLPREICVPKPFRCNDLLAKLVKSVE